MSWRLLRRVLDYLETVDRKVMSPEERLAYIKLAYHAGNDDGTECYPSQQTIARFCGLAVTNGDARSTRDVLRHLHELGGVDVLEPPRPHQSARYQVHCPPKQTSTASEGKTSTARGGKPTSDQIGDQHATRSGPAPRVGVAPTHGPGEPVRTPVLNLCEPAPAEPAPAEPGSPTPEPDNAAVEAAFLQEPPDVRERLRALAINRYRLREYALSPEALEQHIHFGAVTLYREWDRDVVAVMGCRQGGNGNGNGAA